MRMKRQCQQTVLLKIIMYMIITHMSLGLKFLLCLNEKCFDFKKTSQISWIFNRNRNILVWLWVQMFLLQGWVQAEVHIYTIIHNCNILTFLIALLVSPIFLLYELWPPCRYVLSNLATGYWSHFVTPNNEFKTSPTNSLILQVPQIWQIWQDTIHSFLLSPVPPCESLCQSIHLPPPSPSNSSPLPWHEQILLKSTFSKTLTYN